MRVGTFDKLFHFQPVLYFMFTYHAYSRSIALSTISYILFVLIGVVIFSLVDDAYLQLSDGMVTLVFALILYISYGLCRLVSRAPLHIQVQDNSISIRRRKQLGFEGIPYTVIPYQQIKDYVAGPNSLKLVLNDGTKIIMLRKMMHFVYSADFDALFNDFEFRYRHFIATDHKTANAYSPLTNATQNLQPASAFPTAIPASILQPGFVQTSVVTKRGGMFYLNIAVVLIFYFGLFGSGILAIALSDPTEHIMMLVAAALYAFGIYSLRVLYRISRIVKLDNYKIEVGSKVFSWQDVVEVSLSGKQPYKYILNYPMEGAMLCFKDGTSVYMHDNMYSNLAQVKMFIAQHMQQNKPADLLATVPEALQAATLPLQNIAHRNAVYTAAIGSQYFKGQPYKSLMGAIAWIGLICAILGMLLMDDVGSTVVVLLIGVGWFMLFSLRLNYFVITADQLIVKRHYFLWKKRAYQLTDIKEVLLDQVDKKDNTLTITLKDFSVKSFQAASLSDETWLKLKNTLESMGIPVRDENNFAELVTPESKRMSRRMSVYLSIYVVFCISVFCFIDTLNVDDTALIFIKLAGVLVCIAGLVLTLILAIRTGRKNEEHAD